jgi:hypothetical protein
MRTLTFLFLSLAYAYGCRADGDIQDPFHDGVTAALECQAASVIAIESPEDQEARDTVRFCGTYVMAVLQTVHEADAYTLKGRRVCMPDNLVPNLVLQGAAAVAEQQKAKNDSTARLTYAEAIIESLSRNYPCAGS